MIDVGSFFSRGHGRVTRRAFVKAAFGGSLFAGVVGRLPGAESSLEGKAKSVIFLWLWGGPSHIDTFDPKPEAPIEIRGPFASIATRTPGLRFSELFPRLAQRSQTFCVVRSNRNLSNIHRIAGSIALTGGKGNNGDDGYGPAFGSVVQKVQNSQRDLPPFVAVTQGKMQTSLGVLKGYGGGTWGKAYDPFSVHCTDRGDVDIPELKLLEGLAPDRLNDRSRLRAEFDRIRRMNERVDSSNWDVHFESAYRLLVSPEGRRAFDLSLEPEKVRGAYGRTVFGQSCLLARRLVEASVPYVQVNWSKWVENIYGSRTDWGWDTHRLNFENLTDRHGPILDRALSALLDDLRERGLLESTLVVCLGEFGRTPKISANGGRDHWPRCYCSLWAGAGIQPGRVVGKSDERGYDPLTEPVSPGAVGATILSQVGVTTEKLGDVGNLADKPRY